MDETRRKSGWKKNQTFAVDLSVLLRLGGGLQALATLGASEAVLVPGLCVCVWGGGERRGGGKTCSSRPRLPS